MQIQSSFRKWLVLELFMLCLICCYYCKNENSTPQTAVEPISETEIGKNLSANLAYESPLLDGEAGDACWENAEWQPLNQFWIGEKASETDFAGRYKLAWDASFLYVLAEITDDTLIDIHADGLTQYWDDDCLEIFVDADGSGGNHQYSHNAFAYHLSLDGHVVDVAPDSAFTYYNDHCTYKRTCSGKTCIWEVAVRIYPDTYVDGGENVPMLLTNGKKMGFALAYCDNDHSTERENFIGSVYVPGEDKNRGWIDAGIFGKLELVQE